MTPWAHLPNAALIDEVLASAEADPEKWDAARVATWDVVQDTLQGAAAWNTAWDTAWAAAQAAARNTAWRAARSASWNVARNADLDAAWGAAWSATATLIAYDGAGQFIKLPAEHLRRLHRIDPHPMFLLLQPAAIVFAEQGDPVCLG